MNRLARTFWLVLLLSFAMITISGCWQAAGDNPEATPIARALPTATDLPSPTPTDTPEPPEETEEPFGNGDIGGTAVAQIDEPLVTIDPLIQEATNNILRATQEVLALTQTAEAIFLIPTATDTPGGDFFQPTTDPNFFITPTFENVGGGFATQAPIGGNACQHTVQQGQNLFRISLLYNVTLAELVAQNGITNQNLVLVGRVLNIPGCGNTNPNPPSGVDPNGGWAPGMNWENNSAGGVQYTIQPGDNLFRISLAYRVPFLKIAAANGIPSPYVLTIGRTITIP